MADPVVILGSLARAPIERPTTPTQGRLETDQGILGRLSVAERRLDAVVEAAIAEVQLPGLNVAMPEAQYMAVPKLPEKFSGPGVAMTRTPVMTVAMLVAVETCWGWVA